MKIIIALSALSIGGGTNVVLEHASQMKKNGEDVYLVTEKKILPTQYNWHPKAAILHWVTYDEIKNQKFDIAIATYWRTVYEMYKINATKYIYFVQSVESRFYDEANIGLQMLAEMTYLLNLNVITEATWIREYLKRMYNIDAILVRNGINKEIFNVSEDFYPRCEGLRVLIEGPIDVPFKNVPKTIKLVRRSRADEIWLLTKSEIKKYKGVDRVFSKIPIEDCAKIYRSCDVLVKLSYVEGMFGPPLEMFHCGGTAIVYDVSGHDEYVNNENGIIIKTNDEKNVIKSINKLKDNPDLLNRLKENALKTASEWVDWEKSSNEFYLAVKSLYERESVSQRELEIKSKFYKDIYYKYEYKTVSLKRKMCNVLKNKFELFKIRVQTGRC